MSTVPPQPTSTTRDSTIPPPPSPSASTTFSLATADLIGVSLRKAPVASIPDLTVAPSERCTSPRRDNSDIERIGREKVSLLQQEAQHLQQSLSVILERIDRIKEEYERLASENRFLQDYIGNLMSTGNLISK